MSDQIQMDSWTRYLHRDHAADELRDWARRLEWFRFCRAIGGHANDGDQLLVALRCTDPSTIWTALGGARTGSGAVEIRGVSVGVIQLGDRLLLSLSGASGDPFRVTEADVRRAEALEQSMDALQSLVIEPPIDERHCVAPKFYPELWSSDEP